MCVGYLCGHSQVTEACMLPLGIPPVHQTNPCLLLDCVRSADPPLGYSGPVPIMESQRELIGFCTECFPLMEENRK